MAPPNAGLTLAESKLLSLEALSALHEQGAKRMQFLEKLLWVRISGDCWRMARILGQLMGADPDFDTVPVATGDGTASPQGPPQPCYELKLLVQDIYVRDRVRWNVSAIYDQLEIQVWAAVRRFLYTFVDAFFNGSQFNPGQPDGLDRLIRNRLFPNDMVNGFLTLEDLARVFAVIACDRTRGPIIACVSALGWKNILKAYYDKGINPPIVFMEFWDDNGYLASHPVLCFEGVPIFIVDQIRDNQQLGPFNDATAIYFFQQGPGGVYAITGTPEGKPQIEMREALDAAESVTCFRLVWSVGVVLEADSGAALLLFRAQQGTQ